MKQIKCMVSLLTLASVILVVFASGCVQPEESEPTGTVKVMECYMNDTESDYQGGIGKLCESNQECVDYIKSIGTDYETSEQIECKQTAFKKITKKGDYISCDTNEDCFSELGWEPPISTDETIETVINSWKQTVRCNDDFCEMTEGFLDTLTFVGVI